MAGFGGVVVGAASGEAVGIANNKNAHCISRSIVSTCFSVWENAGAYACLDALTSILTASFCI